MTEIACEGNSKQVFIYCKAAIAGSLGGGKSDSLLKEYKMPELL